MEKDTRDQLRLMMKQAFAVSGASQKSVAEDLGMSPQTMYNIMNCGNMTFAKLSEIADRLGFDVVLRDRESGRIIY